MNVQEILARAGSKQTREVFGEPFEQDGATFIPVVRLSGPPKDPRQSPLGAYIFKGGEVTWLPATDLNRVIAGGQFVGLGTVLIVGLIVIALLRRGGRRRDRWGER
ncbi:MAG: hypothetical protein U0556_03430 [Dehalococcoidia bacterium]